MEKIIGVSAGFHDAAVAIVEKGKILFAGHSERYTKEKNDCELSMDLILDAIPDLDPGVVAYYEKPVPKMLRMLYAGQKPVYNSAWTTLPPNVWHTSPRYVNFHHHMSHAAAGFQTSYFNSAIAVVVDAIGEWDTASIWFCKINVWTGKAEYKKLWSLKYPNSLGLFYSACTQRVGLKPNEDEYILMGMAAYGSKDMSWALDDAVFKDNGLKTKENLHLGLVSEINRENDYDFAMAAQKVTERKLHVIFEKAEEFAIGYNTGNLVYMGGVALNCKANADVITGFWDKVWIMPNPGDAGSALGAAALAYGYQLEWDGAYLGYNIDGEYPVDELVDDLSRNGIAGVACGRAEYGPRALGNRSLLADPRGSGIKNRVNEIKQRQKFRPFAPVILEEHAADYFAMQNLTNKSAEYMQYTVRCLAPSSFPAIVHADGTSRVQTVSKNCKSGIRKLLEAWHNKTGCPMLLNTSLNIKGMPMVNDETDASKFSKLYNVPVFTGVK